MNKTRHPIWTENFFRPTGYRALAVVWIVLASACFSLDLSAQRLSRDYNVDILINQAGYLPSASKACHVKGLITAEFRVIDVETREVVHTGVFKPGTGDFGGWSTGRFNEVTREGYYYILCDTLRSYPFEISRSVYDPPMALIVNYFSKQRCGGSATGYLTPCHLDDGVRMDNGKHQDVSGGWHDASDLRKWVGATIYGMIGLGKAYDLFPEPDRVSVLDELKWGNRYFLHMQEPQGYIMSYVGGDVLKHSDSNRWTDNETGEEGGDVHFTRPNAGMSMADMLIAGTKDDRVIKTDPLDMMGQYNFITAEAMMARITRPSDPSYSDRCLKAAIKCFEWCGKSENRTNPGIIGASIQAATELYTATGEENYKNFAVSQASILKNYQETDKKKKISGYYYESPDQKEPYKNIWNGCMEFFAISDLVLQFPDHQEVKIWKEMISGYAYQYLTLLAGKNNFGIVPFGLYPEKDPGGNRQIGNYWYRYFMQPEQEWWVGINANLASCGMALLKASKVLQDPELKVLAQQQLDWITGVNPFNSSTFIGVGFNHPKHFPGSTFYPQTPVIYGAVMNGLGGDHNDQPSISNGSWQISEYWTPMVAYTLWLMAELTADE